MAKKVYLASPFFDKEQLERVQRVEAALAQNPTVSSVFSPRTEQLEQFEEGTKIWANAIFKNDINELEDSDIILSVVDFVDDFVDSGTAFEVGYAVKAKKPIVVFHEKDNILNLMISESKSTCRDA